ncbi:MAG: hypothetical protein L6264_09560 [Weeksellaceae bacterium]|nr:hypothetical protein [Bacteroidota bacterium]MCG2781185.1 hypothetical protein [Weeksellaceae bacterium]
MDRLAIIEKTISIINKLPERKAEEISDFADFLLMKYEENLLNDAIAELVDQSKAYDFLKEDEVMYSVSDINIKYGNE